MNTEKEHGDTSSASYASGSLMTAILNFKTLIKVSCLHCGQYNGKYFNSVISRIFILVLFPHTGQSTHLYSITLQPRTYWISLYHVPPLHYAFLWEMFFSLM